jgi:hypothetical protein
MYDQTCSSEEFEQKRIAPYKEMHNIFQNKDNLVKSEYNRGKYFYHFLQTLIKKVILILIYNNKF